GSNDSDVTALIVMPHSSPSAAVAVTIETPVSQWLAICLNRSGVTNRSVYQRQAASFPGRKIPFTPRNLSDIMPRVLGAAMRVPGNS
ncbi:MAG: hypothetical protein ABI882_16605, partial [Acidobacteriota bacterium]